MTTLEVNLTASGAELALNVNPPDVLEVNVGAGSSGGGTTVHGELSGRNSLNQHDPDAITVGAETLTERLLNTPKLDAANEFTAAQSIDVTVPLTPAGDVATTKPTVLVHLHPTGGQIVDHIAVAVDLGGGVEFRASGTLVQVVDSAGDPTDEWILTSGGEGGVTVNLVESSDPGELPYLLDLLTPAYAPLTVGDPTVDTHAATKGWADARFAAIGIDSNDLGYIGTGLLLGVTNTHDALHTTEGILDRNLYCCGMSPTTNIDVSATNPTLEFGGCVADGYVWLNGQTDPDENGTYQVNGDLTITRKNHPDVSEPPGNGAERRLLAPAEPEHGLTYTWFNDDRTKINRAGSIPDYEAPDSAWSGEWVKTFDPTASGGVDSVNGQTGVVVLDETDVGAPPTSRTVSAGTGLTGGGDLTASRTLSIDPAVLSRIPTTVRVASDVDSPTDGSFTNTTGLSFSVVNGTTYYISGVLDVTGINAADLKVTATCPAGTIRVAVWGKNYATTATASEIAYSGEITSSGEAVSNLAVITGRSTCVPFSGYFECTADGTFQIQHAQRTANATATVAKAGSYLTYHT